MHDQSKHHLLAPSNLPRHIAEDHGNNVRLPSYVHAHAYLVKHGIESTGNSKLDTYLTWHEKTHAYSASRTTKQRRAEQHKDTKMKKIAIKPTDEHELCAPDERHRLVFGGSNMDTVIHLTDAELTELRQVLNSYPK